MNSYQAMGLVLSLVLLPGSQAQLASANCGNTQCVPNPDEMKCMEDLNAVKTCCPTWSCMGDNGFYTVSGSGSAGSSGGSSFVSNTFSTGTGGGIGGGAAIGTGFQFGQGGFPQFPQFGQQGAGRQFPQQGGFGGFPGFNFGGLFG